MLCNASNYFNIKIKKVSRLPKNKLCQDKPAKFHTVKKPVMEVNKYHVESHTIVKFTQLWSKFPPTALLNFACDWLALDTDIFGRLTSSNV